MNDRPYPLPRGVLEAENKREPELRVRVIYDPHPDLSYLDQDEFADTDPDDIVSLAVLAEVRCPCCERWDMTSSALWGIDFMDNDRSLLGIPYEGDPFDGMRGASGHPDGTYSEAELRSWLEEFDPRQGRHYLATVALEVLDEARRELAD